MKYRWLSILSACALLFFLPACGGDGESSSDTDEEMSDQQETMTPAGSAVINGTVNFEGTAPEREELDTNRECEELRDSPPLSQNAVVNDNGTLKWVFVYVTEGLEDESVGTRQKPVVLDQNGCMYEPHVFGVQTGQPISIRNSDPFQHNIHALPDENRPFNFSQPTQGMETERTFQEPEVMVRIKCDVHGWMEAWAGVVGHPFHSTTGSEGTYSLANLPAGEYEIEAWHEEYGAQTQTVSVAEDDTTSLDFTFSAGETADAEKSSNMSVVTWTIGH